MLPVLFTAATLGVTRMREFPASLLRAAGFSPRGDAKLSNNSPPVQRTDESHHDVKTIRHASIGGPMGLLVCVLLFHFWMGSSPFAQSQRIYATSQRLNNLDPRMPIIDRGKKEFPTAQTTIIATERMAAHFTDYRMVLPAPLTILADTVSSPHVLILDLSDGWDKIGLEQSFDQKLKQASDAGYTLIHEYGPVLILANEAAQNFSK